MTGDISRALLPESMLTVARAGMVVGWDLQFFLNSNPDFNLERPVSCEPQVASPLNKGQPKLAPIFCCCCFFCHLSLKHQSLRPVSTPTLQMEKLRLPKGTPRALSQVLGQCNTPGTALPSPFTTHLLPSPSVPTPASVQGHPGPTAREVSAHLNSGSQSRRA